MDHQIKEQVTNWIIYYKIENRQYNIGEFETKTFPAYTEEQALSLFKQFIRNTKTAILAVVKDFNADVSKKANES